MIIPVRCFTCSKVIGNKYEKYIKLLEKKEKYNDFDERIDNDDIFNKINLKRYCCRRMVLTHVEILHTLHSANITKPQI